MYKALLALWLLLPAAPAVAGDDVASILRAADAFRLPEKSSRVDVNVSLIVDGKVEKESQYRVYASPGRKSLVIFRAAGELGQKALQLDDRFYLLMPRSQLPVRISPMQKLMGEAAVGDISTMTWSEDYAGAVAEKNADVDGRPCLKLELKAAREGATYGAVDLYVTKDRHFPVKASLYLPSGRIAKTVDFKEGDLGGFRMVTGMILHDQIQVNRETEVRYSAIKPMAIPETYYNPAYLTRTNVE